MDRRDGQRSVFRVPCSVFRLSGLRLADAKAVKFYAGREGGVSVLRAGDASDSRAEADLRMVLKLKLRDAVVDLARIPQEEKKKAVF